MARIRARARNDRQPDDVRPARDRRPHRAVLGTYPGRPVRAGNCGPEDLAQGAGELEVWTAPDLVLSQTCGMPYRLWLHERVALVGTPDYGLEGCAPGHYSSALVVRADDPREALSDYREAVFAYNQTFSHSGYAAPYALCAGHGFWFENRVQTHGHRMSAQAVTEGRADIAALDGVTWRLMQAHEELPKRLARALLDRGKPGPAADYGAG